MTAKEMIPIEQPQPMALQGKALEEFVVRGNLSALSPTDKAAHYIQLCHSLGLNPATKPFEYLTLQGREILYARRECTEQLRKIHNVSLTIADRAHAGDVYIVTARATLPDGRSDESTGAVNVANLKGDNLANALMKCETKAKRRVTLSICGLGFLDESELDTIQGDRFANLPREQAPAKPVVLQPVPKTATLPALPDRIDTIPVEIVKVFATLGGLEGVPIVDMSQDDLELVLSVCRDNKPKVKTALAKQWLGNIEARALEVLDERGGVNLGEVAP